MGNKGFCIISTRENNVVNIYTIATMDFIKNHKNKYCYKNCYLCDSYKVLENVGGQVIIEILQKMKYSGVEIKTTLKFEKDMVVDIRIEDFIC